MQEIPENCDACGFETKDLEKTRCFNKQGEEHYLFFCNLCVNTHSATSVIYKSNQRDVADALKAIAFVGNTIIQEIKRLKN